MLNFPSFSEKLERWSKDFVREMPWLAEKNPYKIWISEIMLQQTRVDQVIPFYNKFINAFPDINSLSKASQDQVLYYWEGLGYYSRARNIHFTAQMIINDYNGIFPSEYDKILSLKGIGPYTAAAISSFAFNTPIAAVDGNVVRLISRIYGIKIDSKSSVGLKKYQTIANSCIGEMDSSIFNQAMMNLGAQICTPKNPICKECPFELDCHAYQNQKIHDFPPKQAKIQKTNRFFHYFIIQDDYKNSVIKKRVSNDIWKGLFEFILIENKRKSTLEKLKIIEALNQILKFPKIEKIESVFHKHPLTHQDLYIHFYTIRIKGKLSLKNNSGYLIENAKNFLNFAFPRIVRIFLLNEFEKE